MKMRKKQNGCNKKLQEVIKFHQNMDLSHIEPEKLRESIIHEGEKECMRRALIVSNKQ